MRMYDPVYLALLRAACDRYGVHLIADEIAVGFGRTGRCSPASRPASAPDFLCLSKGLTGGYLPLSVVLTTDAVYQAFYDDDSSQRLPALALLHRQSAGLPRGARGARHLPRRRRDRAQPRARRAHGRRARAARRASARRRGAPDRHDRRGRDGARTGERASAYDWRERRGLRVYRHGLEHGALLRPIGNVVYFMPPYVIEPDEIDSLVGIARGGIRLATCD